MVIPGTKSFIPLIVSRLYVLQSCLCLTILLHLGPGNTTLLELKITFAHPVFFYVLMCENTYLWSYVPKN